jgi:filamentous hemagglutinin family protein
MNRHASMNRIFRLVWNESLNAFVPAAETARGRGKSSKRKLIAVALSLTAGIAQAGGPTGGQVTGGSGTITQSGSTTTIQQSSQNLSLNWQTFNITPQETVDFVQPNSTAIAVNRILGTNGSVILGHLNANGEVYLINPNGVLFGKGAEVNVGALVASTLDLNASTPGDTSKTFSGTGTGSVINDGTLTAAIGGTVALLGNRVSNNGVISAQLGTVALGAGRAATLTFRGISLVTMQIDQSVLNSVAANGGLIRADGGQVLMTAGAQKALLASVVNNTGVIEARTLENHEGTITLLGGMTAGTVNVAGSLDASAPTGGSGGAIETSAAHVEVAGSAKVTTAAAMGLNGTWLIDPTDFTIAPSGGDETGAQLSSALGGGNVTIQSNSGTTGTAGDINVNDIVTWSANTLTLSAQNNININSQMTGSGTAGLALKYGQGAVNAGNLSNYNVSAPVNLPGGPNFSTQLGSDGAVTNFTVITSLGQAADATTAPGVATLQGIAATANLGGNFALGANIDATATATWNPVGSGFAGFSPVGTSFGASFTGSFDGLGHTISNLFINLPTTPYVGMFGFVNTGGVITNVGVVNANVTGGTSGNQAAAGILVGASYGRVTNSSSSGAITDAYNWATGGLVGANGGIIDDSHSSSNVSGGGSDGGLVGSNNGSISNSFATGQVIGQDRYIGGLVGTSAGSVNTSYATGSVSGSGYVGGLVGANEGGSVNNSYATGSVNCISTCTSANTFMGGLVGFVQYQNVNGTQIPGTVSNSHATGTVTGGSYAGGLVGADDLGPIVNSYSTGSVVGIAEVGGLIGNWPGLRNGGTLSNSFYDIDQVTINGAHQLTMGGLYDAQYQNWFTHGETLNIANYSATLPAGTGGYFNVGSVQGLQDMLGFVESNAADNFRLTADLTLPAGFSFPYFAGSFDGGNHTLANLSLNFPNNAVGLFGYLPSSATTIANVGVPNANVSGLNAVGGLVGLNNGAAISNSYVSGIVSGSSYAGGLVGYSPGGSISNSYSSASVTARSGYGAGGLVGVNYGSISQSYATGKVNGSSYVGGLVGLNYGTVANSYYNKTANPTLTGLSNYNGPIADAPGVVSGLTTAQLETQSSFSGWDFGNTWFMYEGTTTPLLRPFMTALTVTANNATETYSGSAHSGGNGVSYTATSGDGNVLGLPTYSGSSQGAVNAGTYSITPSGLYSDQQGYIISNASGSLTINPASLTVVGSTASKVYDGTTVAPLSSGALVGVIGGDTVTLTQAGNFASKNVGTGIAVSASDSIGGASAEDYTLVEPTGVTGTIAPATLTVSGTTVGSKVYNGTTVATLTDGSLVGVVSGDSVTLNQSGIFASANAGTGIAVVATDSLSGASADDYSIAEPTGLTGSILPSASPPGGPSGLVLAALNARTQIVENFIYPQLGANPQAINASPTIAMLSTPADGVNGEATGSQQATTANVSMKIGANGTLKIENGGLRLPSNLVVGTE